METASESSPESQAVSFTDCPHCRSLCLGPTILPCGHVTCRKCLRHLLQHEHSCSVCQHGLTVQAGSTVSQLTALYSPELVLQELVIQRLQEVGPQCCQVCHNREATSICQDCGEVYCEACSSAHRKMGATRDHVQQPLPHALSNAAPRKAVRRAAGFRLRSRHPLTEDTIISNLPASPAPSFSTISTLRPPPRPSKETNRSLSPSREDTISNRPSSRHSKDTLSSRPLSPSREDTKFNRPTSRHCKETNRPLSPSREDTTSNRPSSRHSKDTLSNRPLSRATSESTLCNRPTSRHSKDSVPNRPPSLVSRDSISNPLRAKTVKPRHNRQWIEQQVQLLTRTTRDVRELAEAAQAVASLAQELAEEARKKEEILNFYTQKLSNAEVRLDRDGYICVSGLNEDDKTATVKTRDLKERLRDVRKSCLHYDVMDQLLSEHSALKQNADKRWDPLLATPQRELETAAATEEDTARPFINDVLATPDGRLLATDYANKTIKVLLTLESGEPTVSAVRLEKEPGLLSLLSDGLVAVSAEDRTIYLVDVHGKVSVKSQLRTGREYWGVSDGPDDDTLLVSCCEDDDGPARVDVIGRDGSLVRTVVDSRTLSGLDTVLKICLLGDHVLIPDLGQDRVYKVEVSSGRLVDTFTHPELKRPMQVVADREGNVYTVCAASRSVLVRSAHGEEWRRLLYGPLHGGGGDSYPSEMCLTSSGMVVVWFVTDDEHLITRYKLV